MRHECLGLGTLPTNHYQAWLSKDDKKAITVGYRMRPSPSLIPVMHLDDPRP